MRGWSGTDFFIASDVTKAIFALVIFGWSSGLVNVYGTSLEQNNSKLFDVILCKKGALKLILNDSVIW